MRIMIIIYKFWETTRTVVREFYISWNNFRFKLNHETIFFADFNNLNKTWFVIRRYTNDYSYSIQRIIFRIMIYGDCNDLQLQACRYYDFSFLSVFRLLLSHRKCNIFVTQIFHIKQLKIIILGIVILFWWNC